MVLFTLYTYRNILELRQIQQENDVIPFIFVETKELLEETPVTFIDISALVYFLRINKSDCYAAYINLREMTEDTKVIVEEVLAEESLSLFPYLFSIHKPYFEANGEQESEQSATVCGYSRQSIYTYHNVNDLNILIDYANANNIPIVTFSSASGDMRSELEKLNQSANLALLDLTSTSYAIEDNKNLIYSLELFLNQFLNIKIISLTSQIDKIIKYFPLYIADQKPIYDLLPDLKVSSHTDDQNDEIRKVIILSPTEFSRFINDFNYNLIGHEYFKERLKSSLKNFILLNKVKEQKVFSILLFGASGIGKTEVARLIANGLQQDSYLAKINFQNYSSQDALNSLIGSPPGYIGCEHGELSSKVKKSRIGIVLFDEFEKTTRPVFSFFLELLEEGKFTDSMAREYDLDGYILVFTSNLQNESDYKKIIPPELQTRFDLVCEFQEPTYYEKTKFLDLLLVQAESKFVDKFAQIQMTPKEKQQLYDFNYLSVNALRDIKRLFNNRLMDFFVSKGV